MSKEEMVLRMTLAQFPPESFQWRTEEWERAQAFGLVPNGPPPSADGTQIPYVEPPPIGKLRKPYGGPARPDDKHPLFGLPYTADGTGK